MALASQLIPVGDEPIVSFTFGRILTSLNVQVRFFDVGGNDLGVVGARDLIATVTTIFQTASGDWFANLRSDIYKGEITATTIGPAIGATWYELHLGAGFDKTEIKAVISGAPPPGATDYRIMVDPGPPQ